MGLRLPAAQAWHAQSLETCCLCLAFGQESCKAPSGCLQGLRSSIPPNFPYFAVEIGLSSGHVHVMDDEDSFADDFGRGVLVGLLQLPAELMHKRAKQEGHAVQVGRT